MTYRDDACITFANTLRTLDGLAARAEAADLGDDALAAKLADDMFALETQFRIALNQVIIALTRAAGAAIPLDETPYGSWPEVRARLEAVRTQVPDWAQKEWLAPDEQVDMTLPNGMRFVMSAQEFVRDWSMPNLYFHASMAYALLRRDGLALGKADFLPHMARYAARPAE
ncbi:DUF1993 family protein [Altererythrobacter aerius]|uniref:DUF1993 family protein n=1 Tax=Tsuneonella aeria TaxID=1837929 RepID=A0A6I4TD21_9SPHN|nr:DUF1993 family protein [Tsuneonella aeria]MXO75459.1 DUF1993 family protein [Tsuneonella aeria]